MSMHWAISAREFEDFAAVGLEVDGFEGLAIEDLEEVVGFQGAVECAAPTCPQGHLWCRSL
jgi:hypothetical protein